MTKFWAFILLAILIFATGCDQTDRVKSSPANLAPTAEDGLRIKNILDQPSRGELIYIPVYSSIYEGSHQGGISANRNLEYKEYRS